MAPCSSPLLKVGRESGERRFPHDAAQLEFKQRVLRVQRQVVKVAEPSPHLVRDHVPLNLEDWGLELVEWAGRERPKRQLEGFDVDAVQKS